MTDENRARAGADEPPPLTFGIYPGGFAGGGTMNPVPDDQVEMHRALDALQGDAPRFLLRGYKHFRGGPSDGAGFGDGPIDMLRYLRAGRRLDLVLHYLAEGDNVEGWVTFVRRMIHRFGDAADTIAITLEENLDDDPLGPRTLVAGVIAAKEEAVNAGLEQLEIGFNVVNFGVPYDLEFWRRLRVLGGETLAQSVDYVGVDLWAGVFPPPVPGLRVREMREDLAEALAGEAAPDVQADGMREVVRLALEMARGESMPLAGLDGNIPMRITENGWPTGPGRTEEQQAAALRAVVETVHEQRGRLGVVSYEHFDLRDARSRDPRRLNRLGLMRDDYTPKLAFHEYRRLIAALGAPHTASAPAAEPERPPSFGEARRRVRGVEVRLLADGLSFLEGPRWHDGRLYASDFYTHRVLAFGDDGACEEVHRVPGQPSGIGFTPEGDLLIVSMNDRRLLRARDGALEEVADLSSLAPAPLNDMVVDAQGCAYVGNFGSNLETDPITPTALLRAEPDGTATVVAEDLVFPNGSVITPDGRTLIVAESFAFRITAFDVAEDGSLSGRREWARFASAPAQDLDEVIRGGTVVPDGIALDAEGALWVADACGRGVARVAEGGEQLEFVATGEYAVFAVTLGGVDGRTLFMCAGPPLGAIDPKVEHRSCLLACRVDVPAGMS